MKRSLLEEKLIGGTILVMLLMSFSCSPSEPDPQPQCSYKIEIIAGNYQKGEPGSVLSAPAEVKVTDLHGVAVQNVNVTFTTLSGGGSFLELSNITNSQGISSAKIRVGHGPDDIYSAFARDGNGIGASAYIFANTDLNLNLKWSTGLDFYTNFSNKESHDGRILESDNFLIFSDSASDDNKVIFLKIAEEHLLSFKAFYGIDSSVDLDIYSGDSDSKIKILAYVSSSYSPGTYYGVSNYGITFPSVNRFDYQRNGIKHELSHIVELLLIGPENILSCTPPVWWREGIAEYHGLGVSSTPGVISSVSDLNTYIAGHRNPLLIEEWEDFLPGERPSDYYAMFGATVTYLLNERGLNKTGLDVKNMYKDLAVTGDFDLSFQKYMGITTEFLEQNLYDLLASYFAI